MNRTRQNEKTLIRKKKRKKTTLSIFLKTFIISFVILTAVTFGASKIFDKLGMLKPFEKEGGETPILEEELELQSLIDKNSPFFEAFKNTKRANILFLGVNGGLTDTIMLASFDMENKKVDVISIPRDTYFERPGYDSLAQKKINAAYMGDPVNTAKAVSSVLCDMPINYYAVIKYDGVENIVDSMGGVPMDIPDLGKGGMYYNDPYDKPPLKIALPAGPTVLNGKQAVQFLRFRKGYPNQDLGRIEAQQKFIKSAFKQTMGLNLPKVAKTVFKNVNSDITLGTALSLATKATGMSSEDMKTYTIPYDPEPEPPYYVYPRKADIENMIADIYNLKAYETEGEGEGKSEGGEATKTKP